MTNPTDTNSQQGVANILSPALLRSLHPGNRIAMNAVTATDVDHVALNREAVIALDETSEIKLDSLAVTDQKQTGRCWMFAALNVFRQAVARKLNVEEFEFSESYLQFFDKFEKANLFLHAVAGLSDGSLISASSEAGTPAEDRQRALDLLYRNAVNDGGQWNMVVALIQKYGVVPKYAMPETDSSSNTRHMDRALKTIVRKAALEIEAADGDVNGIIAAALRDVHRVLAIHLGVPPTEFVWQYRDKDNAFTRGGTYTPQQFASEFLPADLDQYVNVVNDPRHEYGKRYAVQFESGMWGSEDFTYVNVPIEDLKSYAAESLRADKPVFFACDVNRQFRSDLGVWDADLLELDALYGTDSYLSKADRMATGESVPTHAMVFTGVDFSTPRKWRVENSWGSKHHKEHKAIAGKGYGTMSESWFDDNVFHVVIHRSALPDELFTEPTVLPIWDAMA